MEKYNIELSEEKEDTQFVCSMIPMMHIYVHVGYL